MIYSELRTRYRHLVPSDTRAGTETLLQIGLTGAAICISLSEFTGLWLLGQILLAIVAFRWFVILHSCGHSSFFKSPGLNTAIGHLASIFCGIPYFPWRYAHTQHHVWTGWRDYDPVARDLFPEGNPPEIFLRALDIAWKLWMPVFWVAYCFNSFWNVFRLRRAKLTAFQKNRMWTSIAFLSLTYVALALVPGIPLLKLSGLSSILLLYLLDLITLSQHNYIPAKSVRQERADGKPVSPFSPSEHALYTRTLAFPKWISRHFFLHFDLHSEHHLLPSLPHYHLDQIEFEPTHKTSGLGWVREAKKIRGRDLLLSDWDKDTFAGKKF
jgi:omega-6 fatty acid desaturase (delta-12 desaturase)